MCRIIEIEKPDSILPNLGGQTGLNLAMELEEMGFLKKKMLLNNTKFILGFQSPNKKLEIKNQITQK